MTTDFSPLNVSVPLTTFPNEHVYSSELLQTKLGKKGQTVFTCHARSTLEAAPVEIINETRFCDLSKWTGNKSLLIGHSQGWRQCGGLWFSCTKEGRGGREAAGVGRNAL